MYLIYIDESGNTGRKLDSLTEPIHWLIGLAVEATRLPDIERVLRDLARQYCPQQAADPKFEFHGSEIFHGKPPFDHLTPDERIELYRELVSVVSTYNLHVFVRGIHKKRHLDRADQTGYYTPDHPHRLGFMFLVERIDEWLEEQQPQGSEDSPYYGLLVADEQRGIERDIIESLPQWRESGTDFGYNVREIRFLIDTLHTVPSHDSWLIQLADCLAYIRNRANKVDVRYGWGRNVNLDSSSQTVRDIYRDLIAPHVVAHHVWPKE